MDERIKLNSRWFALTKDNHKGVEHTVMQVSSEEEDGDVLTEREIITWSNINDSTHGDGMTCIYPESEFLRLFKFIGFNKPDKK